MKHWKDMTIHGNTQYDIVKKLVQTNDIMKSKLERPAENNIFQCIKRHRLKYHIIHVPCHLHQWCEDNRWCAYPPKARWGFDNHWRLPLKIPGIWCKEHVLQTLGVIHRNYRKPNTNHYQLWSGLEEGSCCLWNCSSISTRGSLYRAWQSTNRHHAHKLY